MSTPSTQNVDVGLAQQDIRRGCCGARQFKSSIQILGMELADN
jgi:hypothetical protein